MNGCEQLLVYCHKILPLVYDDSLSYYENLCKIADILQKVINELSKIIDKVDNLDKHINEIVTRIVNEALQDGSIFLDTNYSEETKTLEFIFKKVG